MKFLQGDIVIINFPFTDNTGSKPRPCIIVSNALVNKSDNVILAPITTNIKSDVFSFYLSKNELTTPLHSICEVRCDHLLTAHKTLIKKKISSLKAAFKADLFNRVVEALKT